LPPLVLSTLALTQALGESVTSSLKLAKVPEVSDMSGQRTGFLGLLLLAHAHSYALLLMAAAMVGIGSSVFHPESSRVARMASGGRHGMAQSVFQVGGNIGSAMGPLLAAFSLAIAMLSGVAPAPPLNVARAQPIAAPDAHHHDDQSSGHEDAEGLKLVPETTESVVSGDGCPTDAPVREYDIAAINVDITVNRFLDHDPDGRMFALVRDVPRIRAEEARNAAARAGDGAAAVIAGSCCRAA
jgi:hypothetical protein